MNRRTLLRTIPLLALPMPALASQQPVRLPPPLQGEVLHTRLLHQEAMCRQFGCMVPKDDRFQGAFWSILLKNDPQWVEELYRRISLSLLEVAKFRQQAFGNDSMLHYATYRCIMASKGESLPRPSQEVVDLLVHNMNISRQFPHVESYCYRTDSKGKTTFRRANSLNYYERQLLGIVPLNSK